MDETPRIEEPRRNVPYLKITLGHNQIEVQVTTVADSAKEAVELAHRTLDEWVAAGGEDNIAKITQLGSVPVSEQVAVAEDEPRGTVWVPRDRYPNGGVAEDTVDFIKLVPTEDLLAVARVIMEQLGRRSGPEDGNPTVAQLLEIDAEIAGGPAAAGLARIRDSVTDN